MAEPTAQEKKEQLAAQWHKALADFLSAYTQLVETGYPASDRVFDQLVKKTGHYVGRLSYALGGALSLVSSA